MVKGQLAGIKAEDLNEEKPVVLQLDGQEFVTKVDENGVFTGAVDGELLQASPTKTIKAFVNLKNNSASQLFATRSYRINTASHVETALDVDIQPIAVVDPSQSGHNRTLWQSD